MKKVQVEIQEGQLCIFGPLTVNTVGAALDMCKKHLKDQKELNVNLAGVTTSDSASLALLIALMRFVKKQKGILHFVNLPKQMRDIGRVSGIDTILPIAD